MDNIQAEIRLEDGPLLVIYASADLCWAKVWSSAAEEQCDDSHGGCDPHRLLDCGVVEPDLFVGRFGEARTRAAVDLALAAEGILPPGGPRGRAAVDCE
jgi:hypothetical protein